MLMRMKRAEFSLGELKKKYDLCVDVLLKIASPIVILDSDNKKIWKGALLCRQATAAHTLYKLKEPVAAFHIRRLLKTKTVKIKRTK